MEGRQANLGNTLSLVILSERSDRRTYPSTHSAMTVAAAVAVQGREHFFTTPFI